MPQVRHKQIVQKHTNEILWIHSDSATCKKVNNYHKTGTKWLSIIPFQIVPYMLIYNSQLIKYFPLEFIIWIFNLIAPECLWAQSSVEMGLFVQSDPALVSTECSVQYIGWTLITVVHSIMHTMGWDITTNGRCL